MDDIIYFELNNWIPGEDYPNEEPFLSWLSDDVNQKLKDESWVQDNQLCVVFNYADMSQNYCVTAKKSWVLDNCPSLLTKFRNFLRFPDEYGDIIGNYGCLFLEYEPENFGVLYVGEKSQW